MKVGPKSGPIQLEGPLVGEAVQTDAMPCGGDARDQLRMALRLIAQAEPGARGVEITQQQKGQIRSSFKAILETIQRVGPIKRGSAELKPVLPIE
jgi:hypothetical protein